MPQPNCQPIRYCWDAEKVKNLIRLRAELSPLFTGKRNASKYAWTVVEQELNVPLPLSKIIKKWNNLLQEYKAIKLSEEPKRREWPFFTLMDVYFSDQVNDPTLRLFSSTKTFGNDTIDDKDDYSLSSALAAAAAAAAGNGGGCGAISAGSLMDISDMMQDNKSDTIEKDLCDDIEKKLNNNNSNLINNNNTSSKNKNSNSNNNNNNNSNSNNNNNNNNNNSSSINNNNSKNLNNNNYVTSMTNKHQQHHHHQQLHQQNVQQQQQNAQRSQQHPPQDFDDKLEYGGNDLDSTRNDILSRASEHHNIDQYLLSWNNFHGNMCKGFHTLQKGGQMVDVTIAAGGKIFKAHKLVLSVCSPYFQKIFLDNPSTHPILFMTDVNSNYMAGLLDFMYSGQVNVKYDDLPSFLKVAEAMQIKGLHTESTNDTESEKEIPKYDHYNRNHHTGSPSVTSHKNRLPPPQQQPLHLTKYHQSQMTHHQQQQHAYQQNLQESYLQRQSLNLSQNNRNNNNDHHLAKSSLIEDIQNNNNSNAITNNNTSNISPSGMNCTNNNNNSMNNNNNTINSNNNNNNSPKYVIQQTNIGNKLLDSQKYQKYYSKRKLLAQYEQEMRNEKRSRTSSLSSAKEDTNRNYKQSLEDLTTTTTSTTTSPNTTTDTVIKMEPDVQFGIEDDESNDEPLSLIHSSQQDKNKHLNEGGINTKDNNLQGTAIKSS